MRERRDDDDDDVGEESGSLVHARRGDEINASEVLVESNVAERVSRADIPDKTVNRVNTESRRN